MDPFSAYTIIGFALLVSIFVRIFDKIEYLYYSWKATQVTDKSDITNIVINVGGEVDLNFANLGEYKKFIENNKLMYIKLSKKIKEDDIE